MARKSVRSVEGLLDRLRDFLEDRVRIRPGYERAEAATTDVDTLGQLVKLICERKWEPSYDGVVPVQVDMINRSTHEAFHYHPQPYQYDADPDKQFPEKMRIALMNLNLATKEVDLLWRLKEGRDRQ